MKPPHPLFHVFRVTPAWWSWRDWCHDQQERWTGKQLAIMGTPAWVGPGRLPGGGSGGLGRRGCSSWIPAPPELGPPPWSPGLPLLLGGSQARAAVARETWFLSCNILSLVGQGAGVLPP